MFNYSKSIIYTIRTRDGLYVGSTTNFTKRKYQHKQNIKNRNTKLYQTIRDNGGEWDMKPYKEFPCETKQQLNIEEERIRCELKADLNMISCIENKEKRKNWLEKNKDYYKKWIENNKEKKREYQREYHKKYYEENKEEINARRKKDKNKD